MVSEIHQQQFNKWNNLLKEEKKDMQGLIGRGYDSLDSACYLMLKITDVQLAKTYFRTLLLEKRITSADTTNLIPPGKKDPPEVVQIAFTSSGLSKLLSDKTILKTFSREFIEGVSFRYRSPNSASAFIEERSTLLGDFGLNHPDKWHWGNEENPVDAVLMLLAENRSDLCTLYLKVFKNLRQGVCVIHTADTYNYPEGLSKEHFGFEDGLSQPILRGFSDNKPKDDDQNLLNAGEFIFGYPNEYNQYTPSPYVKLCREAEPLSNLPGFAGKKDLGKNGTYIVFRQMEQYVERFWNYMYHHTKEPGKSPHEKALKFATKLVGRWPDGKSLTVCPTGNSHIAKEEMNAFGFIANGDAEGLKCPFGAHIRRMNPRDHVHSDRDDIDSWELSKKHRMLRRGRIYGEPLAEMMDIDEMICKSREPSKWLETPVDNKGKIKLNRGLHFICLVTDISRQFEFVQSVWANTSTFASLNNEVDPLISPRNQRGESNGSYEFSVPADYVRNRYTKIPEFTNVVGAAYFFMPGLKALQFILNH